MTTTLRKPGIFSNKLKQKPKPQIDKKYIYITSKSIKI